MKENQRPALALVGGLVYIAWASHCDWDTYHGWVIAYDETNLQQRIVYNTTPDGEEGGIWMSGQAPAVDDSGNLYISVGNGSVGSAAGDPRDIIDRGESFLKLTPTGSSLTVASWFTPNNWVYLDFEDLDLGSAGMMLIPGTTLAISATKEGKMYLMHRDNMGGLSYTNVDTNMLEIIQVTSTNLTSNRIFGSPVWYGSATGSFVYVMGSSDYLKQYQFDTTSQLLVVTNCAQSPTAAPVGMPGGILSVSANGTNAGSGIVWASHQSIGSANSQTRPGILHAYDAANVNHELWNSQQVPTRDTVGNFAKFVPPTVANGKVYLATFSNRLNVYGLLPTLTVKGGKGSVTLAWSTNSSLTYNVQTCSNLISANWQTLSPSVTTNNGNFQVSVTVSNRPAFYRLQSN